MTGVLELGKAPLMQQLTFIGPGHLRWDEVPEPDLTGPRSAIVRPITVATCDLDVAVLRGRFPLAGPYPFGHEGIAQVVAVGDDVHDVRPGDRVEIVHALGGG